MKTISKVITKLNILKKFSKNFLSVASIYSCTDGAGAFLNNNNYYYYYHHYYYYYYYYYFHKNTSHKEKFIIHLIFYMTSDSKRSFSLLSLIKFDWVQWQWVLWQFSLRYLLDKLQIISCLNICFDWNCTFWCFSRKSVLYSIRCKKFLKLKLGYFWPFSYVYTIS